jgi:hypothetical protein
VVSELRYMQNPLSNTHYFHKRSRIKYTLNRSLINLMQL